MIFTRKTLTAALAALTVATGGLATMGAAEAGPRYGGHHHYRGASAGPVVAGVIGGLALGALAAGASRSAHAGWGYGYAPVYGGGYVRPYAAQCFIRKQRVYDAWGRYAGRRAVRVCH